MALHCRLLTDNFFLYFYRMYNVPHFKASSQEEVIAFMKANPFIVLCGVDENNIPVATHVPVLLREEGGKIFLQAHIMRKQKHTNAFASNTNVLCIFSAAHTYVSASWYSKKNIGSTWNYQAVHATGVIKFLDEDGLRSLLTRLTDTFEANPHSPSLFKDMEEEYIQRMMAAIIAFEVEITNIEHIFKLSQNRDNESYDNIVHELKKKGGEAEQIADIMAERKDKVFPA